MSLIALSIIIPVYNVEKYVDDCLKSIYSQGVDEHLFEVVLVDDGSTDESASIIKPYTEIHTNCTLLTQSNHGLSVARNQGLEYSKGRYVWFVDSDDWIAEGALQYAIDFTSDDSCSVMSTHLSWRFADSTQDRIDGIRLFDGKEIDSASYLLYSTSSATPRFIIKRKLLVDNKLQFLPGVLHEDSEFGYRLIYYAQKIYVSAKSIYNYRQRSDGNITSTWTIENTLSMLRIYQRTNEFADH